MSKCFSKIYVEITNYCNLSCSFCSKDKLPKKEMSIREFEIVLHKIKKYTDTVYLHVKGEPLLHHHLDEVLSLCDKNYIHVCITTNGTLLAQKKDILFKHPIKQINVSLHCENNFPNYFEDVFRVCDELSKNVTIIYRIWTLPTLDLDKLSTIIVDKIIEYYHLNKKIVDKIKKEKNIKLSNNLYLDKDYEFKWPKISDIKANEGTCLGTRSHIAILSNGTVVPCCLDSSGAIKLGNIYQEDLDSILTREPFISMKKGFQNGKIVCDLCKSCTFRYRFGDKK